MSSKRDRYAQRAVSPLMIERDNSEFLFTDVTGSDPMSASGLHPASSLDRRTRHIMAPESPVISTPSTALRSPRSIQFDKPSPHKRTPSSSSSGLNTPTGPYLHNTAANNSAVNLGAPAPADADFFGIDVALGRGNSPGPPGYQSRLRGEYDDQDDAHWDVWDDPLRTPRSFHTSHELPMVGLGDSADEKRARRMSRPVSAASRRSKGPQKQKKTKRFWFIFSALMVVTILTAIDMTIMSTALPTIIKELPQSKIPGTWITSAFLLTVTAFQPFMGGLSDVIGRRNSLSLAVVIFILGSIVCAVAKDMLTLVAGRGFQGVGGGGIQAIAEIILSDLTTLRERGAFVGLISLVFAVATFLAPVLGGLFSESYDTWRWIFWINIPIGVIALAMIIPSMNLKTPQMPLREKIERMDIPANCILFGAVIAILIGVTEGGIDHPWNAPRIYLSLLFGGLGLVLFVAIEFIPNRIAPRPILPLHLFTNITAASCFALTFLHGVVCYGATYMLPIYFQAIKDASPLKSAIDSFPATGPSAPAAILGGVLMAVTGKYKKQIIFWWALQLVAFSLLPLWGLDTPVWQWVIQQMIAGFPVGALFALTLPPLQASLPTEELAHATATFAFMRSLGSVFGIALATSIFTAAVEPKLRDVQGAAEIGLRGATALGFATELSKIPEVLRFPVKSAYMGALRTSYYFFIPVNFLGFAISFFVKELPLPDFNRSEYEAEVAKQGLLVESTGPGTEKKRHSPTAGSLGIDMSLPDLADDHARAQADKRAAYLKAQKAILEGGAVDGREGAITPFHLRKRSNRLNFYDPDGRPPLPPSQLVNSNRTAMRSTERGASYNDDPRLASYSHSNVGGDYYNRPNGSDRFSDDPYDDGRFDEAEQDEAEDEWRYGPAQSRVGH